jgi:hypothetical protein
VLSCGMVGSARYERGEIANGGIGASVSLSGVRRPGDTSSRPGSHATILGTGRTSGIARVSDISSNFIFLLALQMKCHRFPFQEVSHHYMTFIFSHPSYLVLRDVDSSCRLSAKIIEYNLQKQ